MQRPIDYNGDTPRVKLQLYKHSADSCVFMVHEKSHFLLIWPSTNQQKLCNCLWAEHQPWEVKATACPLIQCSCPISTNWVQLKTVYHITSSISSNGSLDKEISMRTPYWKHKKQLEQFHLHLLQSILITGWHSHIHNLKVLDSGQRLRVQTTSMKLASSVKCYQGLRLVKVTELVRSSMSLQCHIQEQLLSRSSDSYGKPVYPHKCHKDGVKENIQYPGNWHVHCICSWEIRLGLGKCFYRQCEHIYIYIQK